MGDQVGPSKSSKLPSPEKVNINKNAYRGASASEEPEADRITDSPFTHGAIVEQRKVFVGREPIYATVHKGHAINELSDEQILSMRETILLSSAHKYLSSVAEYDRTLTAHNRAVDDMHTYCLKLKASLDTIKALRLQRRALQERQSANSTVTHEPIGPIPGSVPNDNTLDLKTNLADAIDAEMAALHQAGTVCQQALPFVSRATDSCQEFMASITILRNAQKSFFSNNGASSADAHAGSGTNLLNFTSKLDEILAGEADRKAATTKNICESVEHLSSIVKDFMARVQRVEVWSSIVGAPLLAGDR